MNAEKYKKKKLESACATANQCQTLLEDRETSDRVKKFLLDYIVAESLYKNLLIAELQKNGDKLSANERKNLDVNARDVKRVLKYFGISFNDDLINRIFGSNDKSYATCTIKKLRNRLVHNINSTVIQTIYDRYESINHDLNTFIKCLNDYNG